MTDTRRYLGVGMVVLGPLVLALWMAVSLTYAQERKTPEAPYTPTASIYKPTRQWEIQTLPGVSVFSYGFTVRVVETSGVCIYVTTGPTSDGGSSMAAISKAQLPPGTGCQ